MIFARGEAIMSRRARLLIASGIRFAFSRDHALRLVDEACRVPRQRCRSAKLTAAQISMPPRVRGLLSGAAMPRLMMTPPVSAAASFARERLHGWLLACSTQNEECFVPEATVDFYDVADGRRQCRRRLSRGRDARRRIIISTNCRRLK